MPWWTRWILRNIQLCIRFIIKSRYKKTCRILILEFGRFFFMQLPIKYYGNNYFFISFNFFNVFLLDFFIENPTCSLKHLNIKRISNHSVFYSSDSMARAKTFDEHFASNIRLGDLLYAFNKIRKNSHVIEQLSRSIAKDF